MRSKQLRDANLIQKHWREALHSYRLMWISCKCDTAKSRGTVLTMDLEIDDCSAETQILSDRRAHRSNCLRLRREASTVQADRRFGSTAITVAIILGAEYAVQVTRIYSTSY